MLREGVDVREATHVKVGGEREKIATKNGIGPNGELAKPSEGGFSVTTEDGREVGMWDAESYAVDEPDTDSVDDGELAEIND